MYCPLAGFHAASYHRSNAGWVTEPLSDAAAAVGVVKVPLGNSHVDVRMGGADGAIEARLADELDPSPSSSAAQLRDQHGPHFDVKHGRDPITGAAVVGRDRWGVIPPAFTRGCDVLSLVAGNGAAVPSPSTSAGASSSATTYASLATEAACRVWAVAMQLVQPGAPLRVLDAMMAVVSTHICGNMLEDGGPFLACTDLLPRLAALTSSPRLSAATMIHAAVGDAFNISLQYKPRLLAALLQARKAGKALGDATVPPAAASITPLVASRPPVAGAAAAAGAAASAGSVPSASSASVIQTLTEHASARLHNVVFSDARAAIAIMSNVNYQTLKEASAAPWRRLFDDAHAAADDGARYCMLSVSLPCSTRSKNTFSALAAAPAADSADALAQSPLTNPALSPAEVSKVLSAAAALGFALEANGTGRFTAALGPDPQAATLSGREALLLTFGLRYTQPAAAPAAGAAAAAAAGGGGAAPAQPAPSVPFDFERMLAASTRFQSRLRSLAAPPAAAKGGLAFSAPRAAAAVEPWMPVVRTYLQRAAGRPGHALAQLELESSPRTRTSVALPFLLRSSAFHTAIGLVGEGAGHRRGGCTPPHPCCLLNG